MNGPSQVDELGVVWAAVPFKGPVGSKRRLAALLDAPERSALSLAMLDDVLDVLLRAPTIARVLLLVPETYPGLVRDDRRLTVVHERKLDAVGSGSAGLNPAVRLSQELARAGGADRLLIVPADLPLLQPSDVGALLDAGASAAIAIAPDRTWSGTNALLLSPPDAVQPSFGEASFERHRLLAERAGLAVAVVDRPGIALDLDTPIDVARLLGGGRDGRAARVLRDLGVERRLAACVAAQARSTTT